MGCKIELVLASGSPRRKELLTSLGWSFSVTVPSVDETFIPGEEPEEAVKRLSREKALAVAGEWPGKWIIAADTVVVLGNRMLGKPADRDEALRMLTLLNGRTHCVFTGVTVTSPGGSETGAEKTEVLFRSLPCGALRAYAASGEGDDKAGAYAIQGAGALLVDSIQGDYFNVVGLPLGRLSRMMEKLGFALADQWRMTP